MKKKIKRNSVTQKRIISNQAKRERSMYKAFGWLVLLLLVGGSVYWWFWYKNEVLTFQSGERDENGMFIGKTSTPKADSTAKSTGTPTPKVEPTALPDSAKVEVPFLVQAPFATWDALHEDACEEASLIMLKYFLQGGKWTDKTAVDQEIKDLIAFEESKGYEKSITLQQLSEISKAYYPALKSGKVVTNATVDQIKAELANNRPVIVGAAGKILPNPHFSNGGPIYHMLVITGYDKDGFITNDPGVSQGENFRYTYDALYNALHNWNAENILNGEKAYMVFE